MSSFLATYLFSGSFYCSFIRLCTLLFSSDGRVKNTEGWQAKDLAKDVYLEIDLGSRLPVYAIEIAGCPVTSAYVKSFKLQYSNDDVTFYSAYSTSGSKVRLQIPNTYEYLYANETYVYMFEY